MSHDADKDLDGIFKAGSGLDLLSQSLKESGLDNLGEIECLQASDDDAIEAADDHVGADGSAARPGQRGLQQQLHPSCAVRAVAERPRVAGTDATDRLSIKDPPNAVSIAGSDSCSNDSKGLPAAAAAAAESSSKASPSGSLTVPSSAGKASSPPIMTGGCGPPSQQQQTVGAVASAGQLTRAGVTSVAPLSSVVGSAAAMDDQLRPTVYLTTQTMSPGQLLQHAATNVQQQQQAAAAAAAAAAACTVSLSLGLPQQQGSLAATAAGMPLTLATGGGHQQLFIPHGSISLHAVPAAVGLPGQHAIMGHLVYAGSSGQATLHRFPASALTSLTAAPLQSSSAYGVVGPAPAPVGKPLQRRNILPAAPVPTSSADGVGGHRMFAYNGLSSTGPHLAGNQSASRVVAAAAAAAVAANPSGGRPAAGTASPQPCEGGMTAFVARPQQIMVTSAGASAAGVAASVIGASAGTLPLLAQQSSRHGGSQAFFTRSPVLLPAAAFSLATASVPTVVTTTTATTAAGSRQVILSTVSLAKPAEHDLRMAGSSGSGVGAAGAVLASGPLNVASISALGGGAVAAGSGSAMPSSAATVTLTAGCLPADGALLLPVGQSALQLVAASQQQQLQPQQQQVASSTVTVPGSTYVAVAAQPATSSGQAAGTIVGASSATTSGHATILLSSVLTPGIGGASLPFACAQQHPLPAAAGAPAGEISTVTAATVAATTVAATTVAATTVAATTVAATTVAATPAAVTPAAVAPAQAVQQAQTADIGSAAAIRGQPASASDTAAAAHSSSPSNSVSEPAPTAVGAEVDESSRGSEMSLAESQCQEQQLARRAVSPVSAPASAAAATPGVDTVVFPVLPPAPRSTIDMRLYREQMHAARRAAKLLAKTRPAAAAAAPAAALTSTSETADPSATSRSSSTQAPINASCDPPVVAPGREPSVNPAAASSSDAAAEGTADEQPDFCWSSYLQETSSVGAPPSLFKHVEVSLRNNFSRGMKVEVPLPSSSDGYWLATVVKANGPLLYLRYEGYGEDSSADFWLDGQSGAVQHIGWCSKNKKALYPPDAIRHLTTNWSEFLVKVLQGAQTVPSYALEKGAGHVLVDRIRPGMRVEVQHTLQPTSLWVCQILENVGGRLLLRYDGTDSAAHDFWLFFLHTRVHPVGWAKSQGFKYIPPEEIKGEHAESDSYWNDVLQNAVKENEKLRLPGDIYQQHQLKLRPHQFVQGWKLEAVDPVSATAIRPATIVEVVSSYYFIVQIDDFPAASAGTVSSGSDARRVNGSGQAVPAAAGAPSQRFCCHSQSKEIMPAYWCQRHAVKLMPPRGWTKGEFRWDDYLQATHSQAAPESAFELDRSINGFKRGMKLEAINPQLPHQVCAATVTKVVDRLLWIHLDNSTKTVLNHIVDMDSFDVFPIGWCESNNCMLKPPQKLFAAKPLGGGALSVPGRPLSQRRAIAMALSYDGSDDPHSFTKTVDTLRTHDDIVAGGSSHQMCPKIYINHSCFSGPLLSKGRLAELPRWVGPGRMVTVLREVLTMLVSIAYKSSRVLRELQADGEHDPSRQQQVLKTKYKGKNYRATVELCKDASQLDDYCRHVCLKLECCPNLISTTPLLGMCPDGCYDLTKTKYNHHYGKKKPKKVGRPPGGLSNLENGAKRGRRRRRPKQQQQRVALLQQHLPGSDGGGGDAMDHSHGSPSSAPLDDHGIRVSPLNGSGDADRRLALPSSGDSRQASGGLLSNGNQGLVAVRATVASSDGASKQPPHRLVLHVMPLAGASNGSTAYTPVPRKRGRPPKNRPEGVVAGYLSSSTHSLLEPALKSPRLAASALQQQVSATAAGSAKQSHGARPGSASPRSVAATSPPPPPPAQRGPAVDQVPSELNGSELSPGSRGPPQYVRPEEKVQLDSNPLHWTKERVHDFMLTTDCASLSKKLLDSDFDGQAFMLLSLPAAQEYLELKLGPAIKLCHHVERLKLAYYENYCSSSSLSPTAAAAVAANAATFMSAGFFES